MGTDQARLASGGASSIAARVESCECGICAIAWCASSASRSAVSIPDDDDIADPDNSAFGPTGVDARDRRLRAGRARWLGAHEGAGQHRVPDQRCSTPTDAARFSATAHRAVAARPSGRSSRVQRLPLAQWRQRPDVSRPQGFVQCRCTTVRAARRCVPRHRHTAFPPTPATRWRSARARTTSSCPSDPMNHDPAPSAADARRSRRARTWCTTRSGIRPQRRPTRSLSPINTVNGVVPPTSPGCFPVWTSTCRITIHYATIGAAPGQHSPAVVGAAADSPAWTIRHGQHHLPDTCTQLPQSRRSRGSGGRAVAGRVARADR